MPSIFQTLCDSVADLVAADPYFWQDPAIPVVSIWQPDRLKKLAAQAARLKLCAFVGLEEAQCADSAEMDPPLFSPVRLKVLICENIGLNDTGKRADYAAQAAAGALVLAQPEGATDELTLVGITAGTVQELPITLDPEIYAILAVRIECAAQSDYEPEQTATPTFFYGVDTVGLQCTDTSANMYYTLDGTAPTNLSPLYTGPFPAAAGSTVRARAYSADCRASAIAEVTI